jgi:ribosomal protein S18 acetylase RimI-like enzyme
VQHIAAKDGKAVVLESTMSAVSFYQRLGFQVAKSLHMMLPARGSNIPTELYEERCMVWRATAGAE